jgi:hypothetical protein
LDPQDEPKGNRKKLNMMKDITLDFGLLIAYAIPGAVVLKGMTFWRSDLKKLFSDAYSGEHTVGALAALIVLSIVIGMLVSVIRGTIIDRSFSISLQRVPGIGKYLPDHYGSVKRENPKYSKLAIKEVLGAFMEAKASEKRPYQFYGNFLVALIIYLTMQITSPDYGPFNWTLRRAVIRLIILVVLSFLYTAARAAHKRYMEAVRDLNMVEET